MPPHRPPIGMGESIEYRGHWIKQCDQAVIVYRGKQTPKNICCTSHTIETAKKTIDDYHQDRT